LPIQLKIHHFLNGDVPVYLPVDPAPSPRPGGCDSVPPYPSRVRVIRHTKEIISALCCALIQIGWSCNLGPTPPRAKVTRSNRVGRTILRQSATSLPACSTIRSRASFSAFQGAPQSLLAAFCHADCGGLTMESMDGVPSLLACVPDDRGLLCPSVWNPSFMPRRLHASCW
jgi:hypothetical protein